MAVHHSSSDSPLVQTQCAMKEFDLLVANDRWREAVLLGKCFFEDNTAFASRTAKHTEINLFAAADDVKDCEGYARPFILPNGMSFLFIF